MKSKVQEKREATRLRKLGYSYKDILKHIPVAKSSLSLWLKDLPLTEAEKSYLKKRTDSNITHGRIKAATANRKNRLEREKLLFNKAKKEFALFFPDPLFQIGISLYWAEGAKRWGMFQFSNSDSAMVKIVALWVQKFLKRKKAEIFARLYTHKPFAHERWEKHWSQELDLPLKNFRKTIYKPTGLLVKKRPNYRGCLRLELRRSKSDLLKVTFWTNMLVEHYHNKR